MNVDYKAAQTLTEASNFLIEPDRPAKDSELPPDAKRLRTHALARGWEVETLRRIAVDSAGRTVEGIMLLFARPGAAGWRCGVQWRRDEAGWTQLGWPQDRPSDGGARMYANAAGIRAYLTKNAPTPVVVKRAPRALNIQECPVCRMGIEVKAGKWAEHDMTTPYGSVRECTSSGQTIKRIKPISNSPAS